jgi:Ca2+-binding EF-hand superfamily protein
MRAERQGDPSLASPERVDAFFKHLDANGDGFIDKNEMESMRKARAAPPPPDEPETAPDDAS